MLRTTLALFAALAAPLYGQKIAGGPLAVNVTTRSATVVWLVEDSQVQLQSSDGARSAPAFRVQKTTFTDLKPNTRYDYNVDATDAGKGYFKTASQGAGEFNFVLYGDTRTRHDVHRKVIAQILKEGVPDFVVNSGYQTENGSDAKLWSIFFDAERELLRQTAIYPALGNHEHNARNYFDFFQAESPYYSFNWGNAHFAVINSDIANVASSKAERDEFWARQTKWLEEDLKTHQGESFRFLVAHHPPMTAVARRQGDNAHMKALQPMLDQYKVTAALFGHDHNYQHYLQNGIHYLISGGGGAPLYDVEKPPAGITQKVVSVENFIMVKVSGATAHFRSVAIDGKTIEEFSVSGTPAAAPVR